MNVKPAIFPLLFSALLASGCGEQPDTATQTSRETVVESSVKVPEVWDSAHNSANSLDWAGIYEGLLPCADCPGMEVRITLNRDMTYIVQTRYRGRGDKTYTDTGNFTWNDAGNTVRLHGIQDAPSQWENTLTQFDMDGNRITGILAEHFLLRKVSGVEVDSQPEGRY